MVRFKQIITILFMSLVFFNANAKNPPPGTGTADIPANILIMLDNSGSMRAMVQSSSALYYPTDMQTDSQGNIYILEYSYNRIKKYKSDGTFIKSFGSYGYSCTQWTYAYDFQIVNDQIYIYSRYGRDIRVLNLDGGCIRQSNRNILAYYPYGIAVTANYIFIRNSGGYIQKYRNDNSFTFLGNQSFSWTQLTSGYYLNTNNAGTKLVAGNFNYSNNSFAEFDIASSGNLTFSKQTNRNWSSSNGYNRYSLGADYDSSGNLYGVNYYDHRLQKFNSSFNYVSKVGSYSRSGPFYYPYGVHVDSNDKVYVADYYNRSVRIFDTNLQLQSSIGGSGGTRLDVAKTVIKKIVSNTDLTSGANFGLMEWGSRPNMRVNISDTGAKTIYTNVMGIRAGGGTNLLSAITSARNYFKSSVSNYKLTCVKNYLIVISDGYWSGHSSVLGIADTMNKSENIQTFAVGLDISNNNYVQLAQKGGTVKPLYASNANDLLNKLTDAIKQAISGRLTYTTPAIMSDVTKGDFIYQSTFKYEKDKQWQGYLKKYKLKADGTFDAEQWDAATKLNSKRSSARNIWTIGIGATGKNNFTTTNRDQLKSLLFANAQAAPTDTQVDNLINFIRGVDTYDQDGDNNTTEEIHKLADIYNSDLIVVGKPDASVADTGNSNFNKTDAYYRAQNGYNTFVSNKCGSNSCSQRTEVVIAGANNGILHAFKSSDGEELWGYVPPMVYENLERIPSSKANTTNSVYGVDGSPVVKDIYFDDTPNDGSNNPRWRTILISGVGGGGKGFFALDITDIDNPKHLFAIQNDFTNSIVKYWGSNETLQQYGYAGGSITAEFDYRKLGETWSTPRIIRVKVSGVEKWVAVFGAGYNGATNPDYGSAVFVVDIEEGGKLLKKIDITDNQNIAGTYNFTLTKGLGGIGNPINLGQFGLNSYNNSTHKLVISTNITGGYGILESKNGNTTNNIRIETNSVLASDTNVKITILDVKDIVNALPADLRVITANGTDKADYIGAMVYASDLEGKITKINLTDVGTLYDTTIFFDTEANSLNGRYLYNSPEATFNNDGNLWLYFGTGNTQKLQEQSNLVENRIYGIKDLDFPRFQQISKNTVQYCTNSSCPTSKQGWYVNLTNSRKLTAEPTIDRDRVYFPLYEPTTGTNACKTGKAILTGYDSLCGTSVLTVEVGTGVLSKVLVRKDRLYVGISGEAKANVSGFTNKDNLLTTKSAAKSTGKQVQIEFWKENY